MACVVGSLEPRSRLRALGTAAAMWVALFAANALLPHAPVFIPPDFDARNANWWEVAYAYYRDKNGDPGGVPQQVAQLEKAQPGLLKAEIARLARTQGHDQHLCARHCRLGRSGRFHQGARRRTGLHRQRASDQGSNRQADQQSLDARHRAARRSAKLRRRRACDRRGHEQGPGCPRSVHDVARRADRLCVASARQDRSN